jgi:feruloyl-CoA synthase
VLSGNSVDHLLVTLGAMTAGIPLAPVSVAYSLQSRDHARIAAIADLIRPGAVFAEDGDLFGAALGALPGIPAIVSKGSRDGSEQLPVLLNTEPGAAVAAAFASLSPDAVAKILFTSGSTGTPKGVLNTHRMLASNQRMIQQAWPFLAAERPVIVDWLPWSHTFGGNHNVNMMLSAGGTVYVDAGRPAPGMFAQTVANLTDVPPTIYFNVPAGYAQLVPALEADPEFADRFFSRLRLLFNAAAALPAALRERLARVAFRATGHEVPVTGSWGATETAPAVTSAHFAFTDTRCVGVPLPGAEVKLVPAEDAYEIRVKGPNVTPGYFARPDLTRAAFDEQGFYRTGDAVVPADPADPGAGLLFRSRIAEDFKLGTGTFVRVGAVRAALLSAVPVLSDAVLAGENRDFVCALAWLNAAEARRLLGAEPEPDGDLLAHPALCELLAAALAGHNDTAGSSARVERLLVMAQPASLDSGEITDKGYVNQRQVLARRAALVDLLYADPPPAGVIVAGSTA